MEYGDKETQDITPWEDKVCSQIYDEWKQGRQYVSDLNDMFDDIYDMLRGERPSKKYDFQSNININKVFQACWTAIPYLMKKMFGATPIIGISSFDKKGAWQREQILEFWHQLQGPANSPHIPFYLVMVSMTLRTLLNGVGYMKKTWRQKMKKVTREIPVKIPLGPDATGQMQFEKTTTKKTESVPIEDFPQNMVVNNKDIVHDWLLQPGQSIRQGRFVIHRTVQDLGSLYEAGLYENLDQIVGDVIEDDEHSEAKKHDDQEEPPTSDIYTDVELYERVGLWNVKKEGKKWVPCFEKRKYEEGFENKYMIAVMARGGEDSKDVLIRFEPSEYEEINYIDSHCYMDPERWNSMGMIEPAIETFLAMNDIINGIQDEMWKNLMPPVIVNEYALWKWDTMKYAPHQRWLQGGDPQTAAYFVPPSNVTRDSWQSYSLLDNEGQQISITNAMAGAGNEKTATTNVMNAQLSAGKQDFILEMLEKTCLIPSAQMDIRFAKKFAHKMSLNLIVAAAAAKAGKQAEAFNFSDWEEIYQYIPAASSVKLAVQKEKEIQEDIQLIQILSSVQNPNTPKVINKFIANILRNRNSPEEAALFDEDYFEPASEAGQIAKMEEALSGTSNQNGVEMSGQEASVRQSTYQPRGI